MLVGEFHAPTPCAGVGEGEEFADGGGEGAERTASGPNRCRIRSLTQGDTMRKPCLTGCGSRELVTGLDAHLGCESATREGESHDDCPARLLASPLGAEATRSVCP